MPTRRPQAGPRPLEGVSGNSWGAACLFDSSTLLTFRIDLPESNTTAIQYPLRRQSYLLFHIGWGLNGLKSAMLRFAMPTSLPSCDTHAAHKPKFPTRHYMVSHESYGCIRREERLNSTTGSKPTTSMVLSTWLGLRAGVSDVCNEVCMSSLIDAGSI